MSDGRYDVVIVGYGPTGEVAANLLGGYGMTPYSRIGSPTPFLTTSAQWR